jgi:hypothetical protein
VAATDALPTTPASAVRDVLEATLHKMTAKASQKTEDWSRDLEAVAASGGAKAQAGLRGAKAELQGKNPVWAAVKGAWNGASVKLKLAAVLLLVLLLLLAPVPTLLLLLGLLIAALVKAIRAAT